MRKDISGGDSSQPVRLAENSHSTLQSSAEEYSTSPTSSLMAASRALLGAQDGPSSQATEAQLWLRTTLWFPANGLAIDLINSVIRGRRRISYYDFDYEVR